MDSRVKAPILPVYITRIMTSLPATDSPGVIPVDSPTVPNAEITSNKSWIKVQSGSRIHIRNVAMQTTPRDRIVTRYALERFSGEMFLRKELRGRFTKILLAACTSTKKVLVLIPPPVDPGDAPMNISTQSTNRPALVNSPIV